MTVSHVVPIIKVSAMKPALDFYCAGLGFTKDFAYAAGAGGPQYAGLSFDGHRLHLSTCPGDGAMGAATYLYVDDIDALYAGFRARGVTTVMAPTNQDWGMREVYVRDPDGTELRFGGPIDAAGWIGEQCGAR